MNAVRTSAGPRIVATARSANVSIALLLSTLMPPSRTTTGSSVPPTFKKFSRHATGTRFHRASAAIFTFNFSLFPRCSVLKLLLCTTRLLGCQLVDAHVALENDEDESDVE